MGGQCSAVMARPTCIDGPHACGAFDAGSCDRAAASGCEAFDEGGCRRSGRPACDVYWDDGEDDADAAVVALQSTAHPLLFNGDADETPRTPRGPVPPWAVSPEGPPVDRTSTGVTPPRSLQPEWNSPPGVPDGGGTGGQNLASMLSSSFVKDLFEAVRSNDIPALHGLLQKAYSGGIALITAMPGSTSNALAADRCDRVDEAVATFLSRARCPRPAGAAVSETLLGAAAGAGHAEAAQLLLEASADPGAPDSQGCSALHRAAEGGSFLTVLLILDRMQAQSRGINVATLTNNEGETPEMLAVLTGAREVCRAFELFSDMQDDAGLRQIGHQLQPAPDPGDGGAGLGPGAGLALLDLAADFGSCEGLAASGLLRRAALGGGLVRDAFRRVPEGEADLSELIDQACYGIKRAENTLLSTSWDSLLCTSWEASRPSLGAAAQRFLKTAELRSSWQRLRSSAVAAAPCPKSLEDFWHTHLTAEAMCAALGRCRSDISQMLLVVLWLYTREAWLFHLLEALAALLLAAHGPRPDGPGEGTTGATPLEPLELPGTLQPVAAMADALAPFAQLVQSGLLYFEEKGVRHSGTTYRPMSVPTVALRRLLDRLHAWRQDCDDDREESLFGSGVWVALGAGGFFCSMSSRMEATRRLTQTRCNVLLCIRPDDWAPCFPKHLCLRGTSVDDVLFPLGALFRVVRATRTISSDLDPQNDARWPVVVLELVSSSRLLEALELLEARGELAGGELEAALESWVAGAPASEEHRRLFAAGELLAHCGRLEQASELMGQSAQLAEGRGDRVCAARTLLACARCWAAAARLASRRGCARGDGAQAARRAEAAGAKALALLAAALGEGHAEVQAARASLRDSVSMWKSAAEWLWRVYFTCPLQGGDCVPLLDVL